MEINFKRPRYDNRKNNEDRAVIFNKEAIALLRKLFSYDPETGYVKNMKTGKVYLSQKNKYISIATPFGNIQAHRLAWLVYYGTNPVHVLDHINHNTQDNRIKNLRDISDKQNSRNKQRAPNKDTGQPGIRMRHGGRKKKYAISFEGKAHLFYTIADAMAFRRAHGLYVKD